MDKNNPTPDNKESGDKGQEEKETSFTQDQVNKIVSKRLAEANTKAEKKLKDEVSKASAEAERQSKLSEAEREKEFKAKQQKKLDDRERTITLHYTLSVAQPCADTSAKNMSRKCAPPETNSVVNTSFRI